MAKSPKIAKMVFPQFDSYTCYGDSIRWSKGGFDFTATIVRDEDEKPENSDCYSAKNIAAWKNDEWFFVGVVLAVSKNGVELSDHAASLWGIDCNFPSRKKNPNLYLSEVAQELEGEALDVAKKRQAEILKALA